MPGFDPEFLAASASGRWSVRPETAPTGFSQDTRTLVPGQMFVALRTGQRDGHDFLAAARGRGAAAALVARPQAEIALPQLVVADPLRAFQAIAAAHRRCFTGPVVGVTGSAGKTSTKDLLALLLGEPPLVLATEGNLNNHLGVPLTLTRLDPARHCAAVIEAGINQPGEMAELTAMIQPDHGVVTLVGPAHLDKLGSLEGVASEKVGLLTAVRTGGLQVFPQGCWSYAPFQRLENPLVLVPANEAMVRVVGRTLQFVVLHRPDRTEVTLGGRRTFVARRVSSGQAQNAALAVALASELGVADADLQDRIRRWVPSQWRGELRRLGAAEVYCDFYNANPASMHDAILAFAGMVRPELPRLYVLGSMEELGKNAADFHRQLGRSLLLRPGDHLFALGGQADVLREGLLENGNDPRQVEVVSALEPVRVHLAGFAGAVFIKGSRRYQLERLVGGEGSHA